MVKLYNPTDNRIEVQLNGDIYVVEANGVTTNLSEEIAEKWVALHGFLEVAKETDIEEEPKKVVKKEKVEDKVEEVKKDKE